MDMDWDLIDPDNIQELKFLELKIVPESEQVQKQRRRRRYSVWISQKKITMKKEKYCNFVADIQ